MFENQLQTPRSRLARYVAFSLAVHALVLGLLVLRAASKPAAPEGVAVVFKGPPGPAPPPPPPAPPLKRHTPTPPRKGAKPEPTRIRPPQERPREKPPEAQPPPPEEAPEGADEGVEGGVAGGVAGGVDGGVAGGVDGGVVGGMDGGVVGGTGAPASEPPKVKNVPPFVIARDLLRQTQPRLSDVYKQSHRGQPPVRGVYKVCVGRDGHVYEVTPVKSVPGADDDIIQGIREDWLYKPQQVPLCFLYNVNVTVQ